MKQAPFSNPLQELAGKINRIFGVGQTFGGNVETILNVGNLEGTGTPYELTQNVNSIDVAAAINLVLVVTPELPAGTYDILFTISGDIQAGVRRWQFRVVEGIVTDPVHRIQWENTVAGPDIVFPFTATFQTPRTFDILNNFLATGTLTTRIFWKKRVLDT